MEYPNELEPKKHIEVTTYNHLDHIQFACLNMNL